ncbi:hypothetical protein QYF36_017198 [Acer negundo]|nr:hypothetical protein QYF36_017198 [Acer negundo]
MDEGEGRGDGEPDGRVTDSGSKEGITSVSSAAVKEDEGLAQASVLAPTVTLRKRGRPRKYEQAAKNREVLPQVQEITGVERIRKSGFKGVEDNWFLDVEIAKVSKSAQNRLSDIEKAALIDG